MFPTDRRRGVRRQRDCRDRETHGARREAVRPAARGGGPPGPVGLQRASEDRAAPATAPRRPRLPSRRRRRERRSAKSRSAVPDRESKREIAGLVWNTAIDRTSPSANPRTQASMPSTSASNRRISDGHPAASRRARRISSISFRRDGHRNEHRVQREHEPDKGADPGEQLLALALRARQRPGRARASNFRGREIHVPRPQPAARAPLHFGCSGPVRSARRCW